jgi:SAM-dependent methyltransferase
MKNPLWFMSKFNLTAPTNWGIKTEIHLDIGCGNKPRNPFGAKTLIGADIIERETLRLPGQVQYLKIGIDGQLPFENESLDSLSGYDFIEHLSRGPTIESNMFIRFMNEAFRVLKPNGTLLLVTPAFPSSAAFQDPTHINFITTGTLLYFTGSKPAAATFGYGFEGSFQEISQEWVGPFSKIWSIPEQSIDKSIESKKVSAFTKLSYSVASSRRVISNIRKPSHLMWLLSKPDETSIQR